MRQVTSEPAGITAAVLSGNGGIVYAETDAGRLLKINAETGTQVEIVGRTPYLTSGAATDAGLAATVYGVGLSDASFQATPPVGTSLGGVAVEIGDRQIPVLQVSPTSVGFLVPWDIQPAGTQTLTVQAIGSSLALRLPDIGHPHHHGPPGRRHLPPERQRDGQQRQPGALRRDHSHRGRGTGAGQSRGSAWHAGAFHRAAGSPCRADDLLRFDRSVCGAGAGVAGAHLPGRPATGKRQPAICIFRAPSARATSSF